MSSEPESDSVDSVDSSTEYQNLPFKALCKVLELPLSERENMMYTATGRTLNTSRMTRSK